MSNLEKTLPSEKESHSRGPIIGVRHVQITLMFLSLVMFYVQRTSLSVAIIAMTDANQSDPNIPTYPNWTNTDTILSSFFWGYIIPQVAAGQLGEYFGPKWFLFTTMTIGSIFNILIPTMAAALGPTGVIICRVVQGLNQGFLYPSIQNLMSRWSPLHERSTISCFVFSGSSVGTVIGMLLSGVIADSSWGWPSIFYVYGSVGIIFAILFAIFGANSPSVHRCISYEEKLMIESSNNVNNKKKLSTPWKSILTSLPFLAVVITSLGQSWGTFTLLTEIPTYMSNMMNFNIKSNSELSAIPYVALFFMNWISGPIADKIISANILTITTTRKVFNLFGTVLPAIAFFSLGFIDDSQKNLATTLLVIAVGTTAFLHSGSVVNVIDLAPNHAGTLFGIVNGSSTISSILGPLTVEFLGDDKKDPNLWKKVFWLAAGINVCCGTFYAVFSTAELQGWNDSDQEKERKESSVSKDKNIKNII